jgi:hypothetical protein
MLVDMVHKFKETMEDVGSGTGALFKGLAPVPIYTALITHGDKPVKAVFKRTAKEIEGKKKKKSKKKKKNKKKKKKK